MLKLLLLSAAVIMLSGCSGDRADLEEFVTSTKANHVPGIPKLKEPPEFEHYAYQAEHLRSPFQPPQRELTEDVIDTSKNCLQPDLSRRKGRLETFAIDNLTMRGTLGDGEDLWALVETSEASVYRVGIGEHLGLYHGQVTQVDRKQIVVLELIPDGAGCWNERQTTLELIANAQG
ncbi:pilus assembly protein PilP [Paraferrimonas sedimenticola]|uniref:Pilus assembly protein PilP n=1 Tax=Paraferrimonas sedimenticola TaxID=375674 RepID=A0AA37VZ94_9GAMM|nr:pilus assembly protein PilP [Paraferrimonas sedimenticola]GLP97526.1 pilus assembly protein PilP [Paraferrimonas sedimenticola]